MLALFSVWCTCWVRRPSRGAARAWVTWASVLTTGSDLSLPPMCPGRERGHRLQKHSPGVFRRLATKAGFVEAALFFIKKKFFFHLPSVSWSIRGRLLPREERGWSIERRGVGRKPEAGAGLGRRLRVLGQGEVNGGRGWEAAGRLQLNRRGFLSQWRGPAAHAVHAEDPSKSPPGARAAPRPRVTHLTKALLVGTLPNQSLLSGRPGEGPGPAQPGPPLYKGCSCSCPWKHPSVEFLTSQPWCLLCVSLDFQGGGLLLD